ncbi:hypothetical protein, partial [Staphylococcus argenteus]
MFIDYYNTDYDEIKNKLYKNDKGNVVSSIYNLQVIFNEDQNLNGLFGKDARTESIILLKKAP